MTQNYKQDLNFCLELTDARGEAIEWPSFDWRAKFYTTTAKRSVTAMCVGGVAVNCFNDGGRIHVAIDKHGLAPGVLQCEFTALIPDSAHPDGSQAVVRVALLDIELTLDAADLPADVSASLMLPAYVRDLEKNLDEIQKAIGCSLDEINARLEAILGREPGTPDTGGSGGETVVRVQRPVNTELTRGVIPFDAEPGRVYRNVGYIKVRVDASTNSRIITPSEMQRIRLLESPTVTFGSNTGKYEPEPDGSYNLVRPESSDFNLFRIYYTPRAPYIVRDADGTFYEKDLMITESPAVAPVILQSPQIEAAIPAFADFLTAVASGRRMQLQRRKFGGRGENRHTRWMNWYRFVQNKDKTFSKVEGKNDPSVAVCRVRFVYKKKRYSPWAYFTYCSRLGYKKL